MPNRTGRVPMSIIMKWTGARKWHWMRMEGASFMLSSPWTTACGRRVPGGVKIIERDGVATCMNCLLTDTHS